MTKNAKPPKYFGYEEAGAHIMSSSMDLGKFHIKSETESTGFRIFNS
jgi:hypothetical protein